MSSVMQAVECHVTQKLMPNPNPVDSIEWNYTHFKLELSSFSC